ncbi:flagellar hook-length control protein FliK [Vibrio sp. ZSDE26]|uniref:Flagellar hook-length control protein FliK n=1 Tax=Vibrio amylolyticus TaxID=2847292 RepID=A0A9X1XK38_9VIBR|nr:flagellar hook-length control protein FliK [Vibrio amylolyticus]MCK6263343.1 flagellar hook-length control protein FliK [Vibrio amylolyticus]
MTTISATLPPTQAHNVTPMRSSNAELGLDFSELLGLGEVATPGGGEQGQYWFDLYDQLKELAEMEDWQFNSEQSLISQLPPDGQFRVVDLANHFGGEVREQLLSMMRRSDGLQSVDVQLGQHHRPQALAHSQQPQETLSFSQAMERIISNAMVPVRPEMHNPELLAQLQRGSQSPQSFMTMQNLQAGITTAAPTEAAANTHANSQLVEWSPVKVDANKQLWGQQMTAVLKDRVQMQMSQDVSQARIRLDPPHLGALELSVRVDGSKVQIQVLANDPALREAIQQSAERLRLELESKELMGSQVSVDVGEHGDAQYQDTQAESLEKIMVAESDWRDSTFQSSGLEDHRITRLV